MCRAIQWSAGFGSLKLICSETVMALSLVSPNSVLANSLKRTVDLLRPRLEIGDYSAVEFAVGTQINGTPHLGTNLTQAAAFVLAREVRNVFSIETRVLFNALDNAPYDIELDPETFHSYQITYRHELGDAGVSDFITELYHDYFESLSERTAVDYRLQRYSDQQSQPLFRSIFLRSLRLQEALRWCVAPTNGIMHVRFPCPMCGRAEKRGQRTRLLDLEEAKAKFEAVCFEHGRYEVEIQPDSRQYLDLNTIYRNVIKEAECAEDSSVLSVMVKGGDWAFAVQPVDWGLGVLGYRSIDCPVRCFCPQIVTETGAKLSKSLIKQGDMQLSDDKHHWILETSDRSDALEDFVDQVLALTEDMLDEPKHFFRSFSYLEIERLMSEQTKERRQLTRARMMRIYRKYFDLIASGDKTIEVRVGYSSMKKLKPGQLIRFVSNRASCLTRVVDIREYETFEELFREENPAKINPNLAAKEQLAEIRNIFSKSKERLGVLAIEIERAPSHDHEQEGPKELSR